MSVPNSCRFRLDGGAILRTRTAVTLSGVPDLFPDTAAVEDGELVLGGIAASTLARDFGTPLVVY